MQQHAADHGQAQDAENDAHEAEIEPHVAVEDVAELVADDALQFVALERGDATARDADGGVVRACGRRRRR